MNGINASAKKATDLLNPAIQFEINFLLNSCFENISF